MRCRLLSALVLLGAISVVHADYVILVVDLNAQSKAPPQGAGPGGGFPSPGGNFRGPGGGFPGGGAQLGGRPGVGGPGPAMGGFPGAPGTPPGTPGMPGAPGGESDAADESPDLVVVVVEIKDPITPTKLKSFNTPIKLGGTEMLKSAHHHWGRTDIPRKTTELEVLVLTGRNNKPLKSIDKQFKEHEAELYKEKDKAAPPNTEEAIKLARWALGYGLVAEFESVMNKLAETDKTNSVVVAYLAVKADLARFPKDVAAPKGILLKDYRLVQDDKHHYAILHNTDATDLKAPLDRLEKDYKRFYYWWASHGVHLPPPAAAPVAILTNDGNGFRQLQKNLTAGPILNDSFAARREGLSVYSAKRGDPVFTRLEKTSEPLWQMGFDRRDILKGSKSGLPKGINMRNPDDVSKMFAARTRALIMKALEDEWEATAMSNESARQLLVASKLLPPNVNAPEWLQFGAGSFFETPMQSPFGGPGSLSPYWLPRFKEYNDPKAKKYGATAVEAMVGVVTDAHFRAKPQGTETPEAVTRRARAAAWSLYYFLAQSNLAGLQKYFKEVGRMPRDIELDATVLKAAFARAFDCVNPDRSPNEAKLAALATRWIEFTRQQTMESEAIHQFVRQRYAQMNKPATTPSTGGGPGAPGVPGGVPGIPGRP